jgi:hypothetical protein
MSYTYSSKQKYLFSNIASINCPAPFDERLVVSSKTDLTIGNFVTAAGPQWYNGMVVSCLEDGKLYILRKKPDEYFTQDAEGNPLTTPITYDPTNGDHHEFVKVGDTTEVDAVVSELQSTVATNAEAIATNAEAIATNAEAIAENAGDIAKNATDIATNAGNIAKNATDIAKNAADITTKVNTADALNAYDIITIIGDHPYKLVATYGQDENTITIESGAEINQNTNITLEVSDLVDNDNIPEPDDVKYYYKLDDGEFGVIDASYVLRDTGTVYIYAQVGNYESNTISFTVIS